MFAFTFKKNPEDKQKILNTSFTWKLMSDAYWRSAILIYETSSDAQKKLWEVIKDKLAKAGNGQPTSTFVELPVTDQEHAYQQDKHMECVFPLLFYHSLELLFKGFILERMGEKALNEYMIPPKGHRLDLMIDDIRVFCSDKTHSKVKSSLAKLASMYWVLKYPFDKKADTSLLEVDIEVDGKKAKRLVSSGADLFEQGFLDDLKLAREFVCRLIVQ